MKNVVSLVVLTAALSAASSIASAQTINLEPVEQFIGPTYTQDGYDFHVVTSLGEIDSIALFNEKYYEANGWDADSPGASIGENYTSLPVVISKTNGGVFDFHQISLTDVYNSGGYAGGIVDFSFNHSDGTVTKSSVTLGAGQGFTAYNFTGENGLISVTFTPETSAYALQFDYVSVTDSVSAVPLPASLPMFGAALLALGGIGFGLRRRDGRSNAAAA